MGKRDGILSFYFSSNEGEGIGFLLEGIVFLLEGIVFLLIFPFPSLEGIAFLLEGMRFLPHFPSN